MPPAGSVPPQGEPTPWWEDAAIVIAIGSLWPVVFGWPGVVWQFVLYFMLALMLVIMARRYRRLRKLSRRTDGEKQDDRIEL